MSDFQISGSIPERRFVPLARDATDTVLIVDDHPALRFAFRQLLQRVLIRSEIEEVGTGADAVAQFEHLRPVLTLIDLDLPDIDGLDLVRRLRRLDRDALLLVVSAMDENLYAHRARLAGANGFVSKNRGIEVLEAALHSVKNGMECFPSGIPRGANRADPISGLSGREMNIVRCLSKGMRNKDIAAALFISEKTVSTHKLRIFRKVGVRNVIELQQVFATSGDRTMQEAAPENG